MSSNLTQGVVPTCDGADILGVRAEEGWTEKQFRRNGWQKRPLGWKFRRC